MDNLLKHDDGEDGSLPVRRTSGGPEFFRQEQVGRHGRPFMMIEFRTMTDGTQADVGSHGEAFAVHSKNGFKLQADDPRITTVGRVLRRTSLDELPPILSILKVG